MRSADGQEISTKRKLAAAAAMVGAAGTVVWESVRHIHVNWLPLAFAGVLAVGAVGITRRSLSVQILSRGAAWMLFFPTACAVLGHVFRGELPNFDVSAFAATSGAALLLARPMLHTKEARAAFSPRVFRRILLAGSTATAASAFLTGGIALDTLFDDHSRLLGALFVPLTLALLGAAVGVVRMRAWGILLGTATSLALLAGAAVVGGPISAALMMLAIPMLALHALPILLARYGVGVATPAAVRVASTYVEEPAARYRVATDDELELDDEPAFKPARAELRSP